MDPGEHPAAGLTGPVGLADTGRGRSARRAQQGGGEAAGGGRPPGAGRAHEQVGVDRSDRGRLEGGDRPLLADHRAVEAVAHGPASVPPP